MHFTKLVMTAALLATGLPAMADTPATTEAAPENPGDRVVCRTETEIGSRLHRRRICMTLNQWREVGQRSGQAVERRSTQVELNRGG